jgi:hypothetical protein
MVPVPGTGLEQERSPCVLANGAIVSGFLSRIGQRQPEEPAASEPTPEVVLEESDRIVPTRGLKKFIASLRSRPAPQLVDLGPVVGSNVAYFGEDLGCKIYIEDLFADIDRHQRERRLIELPEYFNARFSEASDSIDGVLCWDLFDYLDRASARVLAQQLMRMMAPNASLFGFFSTAQPSEARFTKFIVSDDGNLRHRPYSMPRMRQAVLQNRDIINLFDRLRVTDSFLLQTNVREILFRKPAYLAMP